jgi:hypothetical protein
VSEAPPPPDDDLAGDGSHCPLCGSGRSDLEVVATAHGRRYRACPACGLVSVRPSDRPDPAEEAAHYATHRNDPTDPGYRTFLDRVARPLIERLPPGARGLDYGCGPGPALVAMLCERGFPTVGWDPLHAAVPALLAQRYDFVTCTEVAEHFFDPAAEFARIDGLIRPGGWLAVMTEPWTPGTDWGSWRYARDPTHVCFYSERTFRWLANRFGWTLELPEARVALFGKEAEAR